MDGLTLGILFVVTWKLVELVRYGYRSMRERRFCSNVAAGFKKMGRKITGPTTTMADVFYHPRPRRYTPKPVNLRTSYVKEFQGSLLDIRTKGSPPRGGTGKSPGPAENPHWKPPFSLLDKRYSVPTLNLERQVCMKQLCDNMKASMFTLEEFAAEMRYIADVYERHRT